MLKNNREVNSLDNSRGNQVKAYGNLFIAIIIWALLPLVSKTAMNTLGPITYAFVRGVTGLAVILPFAVKAGFNLKKAFTKRAFFYGMIAFLFNTVVFQIGNSMCSANVTSITQATMPIFFLIGGVLFMSEKLTFWKGLGAVLATAGIFVTCLGGTLIDENTSVLGILIATMAPFTWTIYSIFLKKKDPDTDSTEIVAYVLFNGCLLTLPFVIGECALVTGLPTVDMTTILTIAFGGPLALGLANFSWSYGVAHIDASISGLLYNTGPILGVIAAVIAGEIISGLQVVGCIVVLIGIIAGVKDEEFFRRKKTNN